MEHPRQFASTAPDRPAATDAETGQTRTFAELDERANRMAHALHAAGLHTGDHVALVMDNCLEYFEVVWGAMRSGLYVTPINWHLSADEVDYVVEDCEAKALFATASLRGDRARPSARRSLRRGRRLPTASSATRTPSRRNPRRPIDDQSEGSWMFYSSGTTGRPKGIKPPTVGAPLGEPSRVHRAGAGPLRRQRVDPLPQPRAALPRRSVGLGGAVHRLGGTVVTTERFDPEEFLEAIERHQVTLAQLVPTHLVRLLKLPEAERARFDLSSLEVLVHAAAPCPPDVKRAVIEWLGPRVYEYYSGSEGVGFCAITSEEWLAHPGSVGRSLLGARPHRRRRRQRAPADGARARCASRCPDASSTTAIPRRPRPRSTTRGWGSLGDMGWVDEDGYLYLTDRVSNMIISGGVNIYPREVEDVLVVHPAVADVAVIGVPDPEMGESVRAVVQPADPSADEAALGAELIAFCRERIAHFKCPPSVVFVDELPHCRPASSPNAC